MEVIQIIQDTEVGTRAINLPTQKVITGLAEIVDLKWLSKQGGVALQDWLSGPLQAGALEDEPDVLIFSGYVEFLAA